MQNISPDGVSIALGCGIAIGIQATLFTLAGRSIGPVRTSLIINLVGGILAGVFLLVALGIQGRGQWHIPRSAILLAILAVAMGFAIISGVSFSFQRIGVGAGTAALLLGQMLISVVIDAFGRAGGAPIPLDLRRVLGLVIMAAAVMLLIPQR